MMQTFWDWLFFGIGGNPAGLRNVINKFIFVHITVALLCILFINSDPFTFSSKALFPAAAILISMSVAWTARAATIFQDKSFRDDLFSDQRPSEDYVYGYQLSLLIIIVMVVYVAVMAGGGVNIIIFSSKMDQAISGFFMYLLLSMALRECWGVVNFSNLLSLLQYRR